MAKCWEKRACDEEMQSDCPHPNELDDRCPAKCAFANTCTSDAHEVTSDAELLFDPTIDRDAVIKESCLYCTFFLKHGPRRA